MPDMNENAETQQEYFGKIRTDNTKTLYNALNKIAELEKENLVLHEMNVKRLDLQKENAELKEALKGKRCDCMTYLNFKDLEKECAKAKELLKRYVKIYVNPYPEEEIELRNEAEQFLKESE